MDKRIKFRTFKILTLLTSMISCNEGPYKEIKAYGINDTAYYYYNPRNDKVGLVVKKDYTFNSYSCTINKDTLEVGEEFKASFGVDNHDYKAVIESPTQIIIEGKGKVASWDEPTVMDGYKFKTETTGLFEFKGHFEYDTIVIPFKYKFIVVGEK